MKIYLAGPMQHYPKYNFASFDTWKALFESYGYAVVSPADIDRANGFDPDKGSVVTGSKQIAEFLRHDFTAIEGVELLVCLPGHEFSAGAKAEVSFAQALGIPVVNAVALADALADAGGE